MMTGLAVLAAQALLATPPRVPAFHRVHAGAMSVQVPIGWQESRITEPNGERTWTFRGANGQLTLTQCPLSYTNLQLLPMVGTGDSSPQSPYESVGIFRSGDEIVADALDAHGTTYDFNLELTPNSHLGSRALYRSWHHPPAATVTDAVKLLKQVQRPGLPYQDEPYPNDVQSFPTRHEGWMLIGGQPGAGQEAFYLFHTQNAGHSWSLERFTDWPGHAPAPADAFPSTAGSVSLLFWNHTDGLIAEAVMGGPRIALYRTRDGGRHWGLATPTTVQTGRPERVRLTRRGPRLILTVKSEAAGPVRVKESLDGGHTWFPVSHA